MTVPPCPCCGGAGTRHVLRTPPMPVASALLLPSAEAARALTRRALDLWHCGGCDFLWNRDFEPDLVRYDADYEGTQIHSPHFARYLHGLAADWAARFGPGARRIVEVGCGQGEFLAALSGVCAARLDGYDPAARTRRAGRARLHARPLPRAPGPDGPGPADAVFSRMTLEHIARPAPFMARQRAWLAPGGMLAVQVPNAAATIHGRHLCELQYEHVNYFSAPALAALLRRTGLEPCASETDYADQNLSVFARPATGAAPAPAPQPASELGGALAGFAAAQARFGPDWQARIEARRLAGDAVWLWGAGARATAFGANLPNPGRVAGVIDINPRRHGTHVPGTGWQTCPPEHLAGRSGLSVIVMNPVYRTEIARHLASLGAEATLLTLDSG